MPKIIPAVFFVVGVMALTATFAPVAGARIVCQDGFQSSGGNWISTPYCNDAHLAQIARAHGVKVSADEVRSNAAKKYELCRLLGSSPPARDYCPDDGSSGRGR